MNKKLRWITETAIMLALLICLQWVGSQIPAPMVKQLVTGSFVNAVLAVNGDYYGAQEKGYVIRNGKLYRDTAIANQEDLVIYEDGSFGIINESDEERSVAPWEITRVPNAGLIFFDAPAEQVWPSGLMDFRSSEGVAWYQADVTLSLIHI